MLLSHRLCWTQHLHHATQSLPSTMYCWETPQSLHTPTPKQAVQEGTCRTPQGQNIRREGLPAGKSCRDTCGQGLQARRQPRQPCYSPAPVRATCCNSRASAAVRTPETLRTTLACVMSLQQLWSFLEGQHLSFCSPAPVQATCRTLWVSAAARTLNPVSSNTHGVSIPVLCVAQSPHGSMKWHQQGHSKQPSSTVACICYYLAAVCAKAGA